MTCLLDDCDAHAYLLSIVNGHFFGGPSVDGKCMWAETRQYKCEAGHISKQGVWLARNLLER